MPIDKSDMRGLILKFPQQCREAMPLSKGMILPKTINKIVVCGMGGSAIAGDVLQAYMRNAALPVMVVRDYQLPSWIDEETLVIGLSYSGNTEETLTCIDQALAQHCIVLGVTSGGKLKEKLDRVILIPLGLPPRSALGYLFFPVLGILSHSKLINVSNDELNEMLELIKNAGPIEESAQATLRKMGDRIPIIYTSPALAPIGYRIKTQINENAKQPAFCHVIPEMNHNELVGFRHMRKEHFVIVLIRDLKDNPRIQKRMDLNKEYMSRMADVVEYHVKGSGLLARMFSTMYWGDFLSYHMAIKNREDPTPVDVITELKQNLKE